MRTIDQNDWETWINKETHSQTRKTKDHQNTSKPNSTGSFTIQREVDEDNMLPIIQPVATEAQTNTTVTTKMVTRQKK